MEIATYQIKKFNHYAPSPKAIHCLCYNSDLSLLALSRSNNTVEIWDVRHTPHIDRVFIGDPNNSVQSIAWLNNRLFCSGLAGSVSEIDLPTLQAKHEIPVTSGPCWCIDTNSKDSLIAAGTEEGYINIINVHDDSILHEKLLDKQQGRILCIAWEPNGEFLATGSVDAVRVWNVTTGHAIHKLFPGRSEAHKETVVWCIAVTEDFTIISGDSRGKIVFWDGQRGLQIDSHQSHKADILALCLNQEQNKLYCAGVDPLISSLEKISVKSSSLNSGNNYKWIKSIQRAIHDHDVRALAMVEEKLFSGGLDGYLAASSYPPKTLIKYSPLLQSRKICLAYKAKLVLILYEEHMELYHWTNDVLSHVAMIKSYKNAPIRCSAISSDANWIAYSTDSVVRLLRFCLVEDYSKSEIRRISGLPAAFKSASVCFSFSPDCKYLTSAGKNRIISVVELSPDESVRLLYQLNADSSVLTDITFLLRVSEDCERIVAADRSSNIAVWTKSQFHCCLPKHSSAPTALTINEANDTIVVSYADHKIVEYDMSKKMYTPFSRALDQKHPKQWLNRQFPVEGIICDPRNKDVILFYDDSTICVVDKSKNLPDSSCKIPRLDRVKSPDSSDNSESGNSQFSLNRSDNVAFQIMKTFKHLVFLSDFGDDNQLMAVVVDPDTLTSKLPTAVLKKRFGTK
ncbi:U3 small nucleolar RNA-associated protein 4 homolog [Planococcus citri]|uniref:U3 small nucleolar RNA-associated protein 4 homolog n=1 Tax=Planococcus citri TaxID=170843 RepID=UPI0031F910BB